MNFFTYRISLDIRETTSQAFINVKKNDTARKFIFTLTDNGRAYQITEGCTAVFRAKKPDGTILYNNCPIVGNAMEYYLTSQTVAAVGIVECEITLYGSNSKQITSPRFSLAVDDVLCSDSEVESKDEFTALTGAIDEVRASKAFTIKLTTTSDGITADKTFTEIAEKVNASKSVIINMDGWVFPVSYSANSGKIVFSSLWANIAEIPNTVTFAVNASDVWNVVVSDIPTTAQVSAKYTKPASGIPKTDLASDVQASLDKADTALQEHQSLTAYRTSADQDVIDRSKQDKLIAGENITIAADGKTISATGGGGSTIELDTTLSETGKAADAKAVGDAIRSLSDEIANLQTSGLTTAQVNALDGMFKVCAFTKADVSAEYTAFKTAFGISEVVTLSSISVTYDGGDVAVGTAVTALDGVVVTAIYSDGSTEIATGYTISGTIAEGQNTVTVTYQGKTATFTVTGVAESSGGGESGETGVSNESTWTAGVAYTFNPVKDTYIESNGAETAYNTWSSSPYLYCDGASQLVFTVLLDSAMLSVNNNYNAFYDVNKTFISKFDISGIGNASIDGAEIGATKEITIPENAAYFRVSHKDGVYGNVDSDNPILSITPKA